MNKDMSVVKLDYPLDNRAWTLLQIGLKFVEPIDDDVPINKELKIRDSDIE